MSVFIFIFLFILFSFLILKFGVRSDLTIKNIFIGWLIKIGFGALYIFVFTHYYGNGFLYGDTSRFMVDSKILAQLASDYPLEYLKLLFGFGNENSDIIWPYINNTQIWMYGDNGDFINDNRLILRLNSVIHLISNGNIYVHALVHVFLSFIGINLIYNAIKDFVKLKYVFWYALILLPSLSFWGGAVLKESILIFSIGLLLHALKNISIKITLTHILVLLIAIGLLLFNKPYVGLIIIPMSLFWFFGQLVKWKIKFIYVSVIFIMIVFTAILFAPSKINLTEKVSYKQKDLINMGRGGVFFITDSSFCSFKYQYHQNFEMVSDSLIKVLQPTNGEYKLFGEYVYHPFQIEASDKQYAHYLTQIPSNSFYETTHIENSSLQLIKNIPSALWNVIVRPYAWDNGNKLKYFAFAQNILLILLLFYTIFNRKILKAKEKWILFILISSSLFISLLIGWTTPIFGAAVRYKVPVDLFIVIISFILLKSKTHEKA